MTGLTAVLVFLGFVANAAPVSGRELRRDEADLETLVARVLPRAERHLSRHEGFRPFGAALKSDGRVQLYEGPEPENEADLNQVALEVASGLRILALKGEARAVCLVVLVHVPPPGQTEKADAIWIRIEHFSGLSKSIFFPYDMREAEGVELREPFTVREPPDFYAPP